MWNILRKFVISLVVPLAHARAELRMPIVLKSGGLSLQLDPQTLNYQIAVGGTQYFDAGGSTGGYAYSTGGTQFNLRTGGLRLLGQPVISSGSDTLGTFDSVGLSFTRANVSSVEWVATFRAYANRNGAIVFEQAWPAGAPLARGSVFPSLRQTIPGRIGTLEYTGSSCGFMVSPRGSFPDISGGSSKGYIVLAPQDVTGSGN